MVEMSRLFRAWIDGLKNWCKYTGSIVFCEITRHKEAKVAQFGKSGIEKDVVEEIAVYLQRESAAVELESGGLDAGPSPGTWQVKISSDTKIIADLGFTKWDMTQLVRILADRLRSDIQIDLDDLFSDDGRDITLGQFVEIISSSSSFI